MDSNLTKMMRPFVSIPYFCTQTTFAYPYESDNTMLFPIFVLSLFTFFLGGIGIFRSLNSRKKLLS